MIDEVALKLETGIRMLSETVRSDAREGDIGMQLGEIAKANPEVAIGSYPFFASEARAQHQCRPPRPRCTEARAGETRDRGDAGASAASKRVIDATSIRAEILALGPSCISPAAQLKRE
jgi:hypothetical protein